MEQINFRSNFNNKLICIYFTTIREEYKYINLVGTTFKIYCDNQYLKNAVLIQAKSVNVTMLDDIFIYLDSGLTRDAFYDAFKNFYPSYDVSTHLFVKLLFKSV
jgi:hypothetical protein